MCFELYAPDRIARNLLCGHTYCQICLEQVYIIKKRIECPMCRHKHEPNLKPISLSKNFVAMDLASKHLEVRFYCLKQVRKKLQFCPNHSKFPLQFFCEDDQTHLCTECIVEHSGHKFCKQEHSGKQQD